MLTWATAHQIANMAAAKAHAALSVDLSESQVAHVTATILDHLEQQGCG